MSKIGVGVGEDFPVDDGAGKPGNEQDDRAEFEEWRRRRAEWRAQRDRWRAEREEWRARRRAFKQKVRDAARETFGPEWQASRRRYHHYWPYGFMRILGIVLVIALISAVFQAPLLFLALAGGAYFFFFHRHRYGHGACDYDFDAAPASGPSSTQPPPQQPSAS